MHPGISVLAYPPDRLRADEGSDRAVEVGVARGGFHHGAMDFLELLGSPVAGDRHLIVNGLVPRSYVVETA